MRMLTPASAAPGCRLVHDRPGCPRAEDLRARWHAARVRYLTRVIWGSGCRVAVEPVTAQAGTRPPEETARWEAGLLAVALVRRHRPGDDAAIAAVLAGITRSTPIIRRSRWTSSPP
jgi:hypothetical protein